MTMTAAGNTGGAQFEIVSTLDGSGDAAMEFDVEFENAGSPHALVAGRATVDLGTSIGGGIPGVTVTGGSGGTQATLELSDAPTGNVSGADMKMKGTLPGGSPFTASVIGPGFSTTETEDQQPGDVEIDLIVTGLTCDTISGTFSEESVSFVELRAAYDTMGLTTSIEGGWTASLKDEDPELGARVTEAIAQAPRAPGARGIFDLLVFATQLQTERGHTYGDCLADRLIAAAAELTAERLDFMVKFWRDRFGWTPQSPESDADRFSRPGSKGQMRAARKHLLETLALAGMLPGDCANPDAETLAGDISRHLFETAVADGSDPPEVLGEAANAMALHGTSDTLQADIEEYMDRWVERTLGGYTLD